MVPRAFMRLAFGAALLLTTSAFAQTRERMTVVLPTGAAQNTLLDLLISYTSELVELAPVDAASPRARLHLVIEFLDGDRLSGTLITTTGTGPQHSAITSAWGMAPSAATRRSVGLKLRSMVRLALLGSDDQAPPGSSTVTSERLPHRSLALELGGGPDLISGPFIAGRGLIAARWERPTWSIGLQFAVTFVPTRTFTTGDASAVVWLPQLEARWKPLESADGKWSLFAGLTAGAAIVRVIGQHDGARRFDTQAVPALGVKLGATVRVASWLAFAITPTLEAFPVDVAYTVAGAPAFRLGPVRGSLDVSALFFFLP